LIANIKRLEDKLQLRIVSESRPDGIAEAVAPSLEDVFFIDNGTIIRSLVL